MTKFELYQMKMLDRRRKRRKKKNEATTKTLTKMMRKFDVIKIRTSFHFFSAVALSLLSQDFFRCYSANYIK